MKKKIVKILSSSNRLIYAIRREILNDGTHKLTPVVRESGWFQQWIPIVKVNDKYVALSIPTDYHYTEEDCERYIRGHIWEIEKEQGKLINKITYDPVNFLEKD